VADLKSLGEFIQGDNRRVATPTFEATQILLAEARAGGEFFLRETPFSTQTGNISSHQIPHIHPAANRNLHILSLSTLGCAQAFDCLRDDMKETDAAPSYRPQDSRTADDDVRSRNIVARVRKNARKMEASGCNDDSHTNWTDIAKGVGALAWMTATAIYFAVHGLEFGRDASPSTTNAPVTEADWQPTEGTMPNGKPAGYWMLPDGLSFMGAGDISQLRVQAIATALRRSRGQQYTQARSGPERDPLDAYSASRLASGVSINQLQALLQLTNRGGIHPSAQHIPNYSYDIGSSARFATPGSIPGTDSVIATSHTGLRDSKSYTATVRMADTRLGRVGLGGRFDTRFEAYNAPAGSIGMVNGRSGEYYAPTGPNGYVSTRDGTYYSRSGPNGVIDTRTGRYIPTN
jgi:hypothetical protein